MKFVIALTSGPNEPAYYLQQGDIKPTTSIQKARRWGSKGDAERVADMLSCNVSDSVKSRIDITVIAVDVQLSELGLLLVG